MNTIKEIFGNLSDEYVNETIEQILEDSNRNDGVINSVNHRELCKKVSDINKQPASVNLFLVQVTILQEFAFRNINKVK
jgi:hypothetical protein